METYNMIELERYKMVNKAETPEELIACILSFADPAGNIQGRTKVFNAMKMANNASIYFKDNVGILDPNVITREFGLRQQAMYIKHYKK